MSPVESGHELLIPFYEPGQDSKIVNVSWSQNFFTRHADYYAFKADNISNGEIVAIFIAAEFYKDSTSSNPNHITRIGQHVEGRGYKIRIDNRFQYGQRNDHGELRFVVFHNKDNKPYQHRFIETALGSACANTANDLATAFGFGDIGNNVHQLSGSFVGDYLRNF